MPCVCQGQGSAHDALAHTQVVVEGLHVAHEHLALNAVDGGLQRNLAHHTQALDHLVLAVHHHVQLLGAQHILQVALQVTRDQLALQVGLQGAGEGDGPVSHGNSELLLVLWDEHNGLGDNVAHTVQYTTPNLSGLPPSIVALVGAEHQQEGHCEAGELQRCVVWHEDAGELSRDDALTAQGLVGAHEGGSQGNAGQGARQSADDA
mmetsp:Transcript_16711/g.46003  ORF Transcript_16711/g.46003 Transcript_16711/m.46003 type:complete len:206 (-) Transcript_16711:323-940(-)